MFGSRRKSQFHRGMCMPRAKSRSALENKANPKIKKKMSANRP